MSLISTPLPNLLTTFPVVLLSCLLSVHAFSERSLVDGNMQLLPSGQHPFAESLQPSGFHFSVVRLLHAAHSLLHSSLCLMTLGPMGNIFFVGGFPHLHVTIFAPHVVLFGFVVPLVIVGLAFVDFVPSASSWLLLLHCSPHCIHVLFNIGQSSGLFLHLIND